MTHGLYQHRFERDNCGFGLIAQMDGRGSHRLVSAAIESLARLTHRGAIAADGKTGDGCGLLLKTPDTFMRAVADELGLALGRHYAIGMVFLHPRLELRKRACEVIEAELRNVGLAVLGWRDVPVDDTALGDEARTS
ncbi:MAG: hypothetical protein OEQ39_21965, partial [Gammaproteobacteria bacterium]|nr:hypothetical protein [Gammaproteobacteria bacterium]